MEFSRTDQGIRYLHPYYPKRFEEHRGVSEDIIAFKENDHQQICRFTDEMKDALIHLFDNDQSRFVGSCLVVVPSHNVDRWSLSLRRMAEKLCKELNMSDCIEALVRFREHEKLATGGERSIESHISTMRFDPKYDVEGKKVFVLDDVTTTGNSILASAQLLYTAGAKSVSAIAIGKTTQGTSPSAL